MEWYLGVIINIHNDECLIYIYTYKFVKEGITLPLFIVLELIYRAKTLIELYSSVEKLIKERIATSKLIKLCQGRLYCY